MIETKMNKIKFSNHLILTTYFKNFPIASLLHCDHIVSLCRPSEAPIMNLDLEYADPRRELRVVGGVNKDPPIFVRWLGSRLPAYELLRPHSEELSCLISNLMMRGGLRESLKERLNERLRL